MATSNQNLSREQILECYTIFENFDTDKDGTISKTELAQALKIMGCNPNDEEMKTIIKEFDKDRSGYLEFQEFLQICSRYLNETSTEKDLSEGLKLIDSDNDGLISCEDLRYFMANLGERLSEREVDQIIKELDIEGQGFIKISDALRK